jgi:heme-degrading monooxygenase HmoA
MPFVSITRLRLRSVRFLPGFAIHTMRAQKQLRHAAGFRGGALLPDRGWTFWTMTLWDSPDAMRAYILNGAHKAAMPKLVNWCDEASVVHWEQEGDALPAWQDAAARMRREGRPSKIRHPSADHATMGFAPPRSLAGAILRPKQAAIDG